MENPQVRIGEEGSVAPRRDETGRRSSTARRNCRGAWLLLAVFLAGCAASGVHHRVGAGQTLSEIGAAYGVPYQKIARANGIDDPAKIYVGQRLLIPGADKVVAVPVRRRASGSSARPTGAKLVIGWPIRGGTVSSLFGPRWGRFHDGIDIAADVGEPVHAAAGGEVVYDGKLSGYGNVIIIRHASGYTTVYAHNHKHFVKKGQWVRRGQRIAAVGRSGRVTGSNLHFEVRRDNVARDPMKYLPARQRADSR